MVHNSLVKLFAGFSLVYNNSVITYYLLFILTTRKNIMLFLTVEGSLI